MHCATVLVKLTFFSDQCRTLLFRSDKRFIGKRLKHHVITVADVLEEELCRILCFIQPNCVSYNFKLEASPNGHYKCELNNSTHDEHEDELLKNSIFVYHGTEVRNILDLKDSVSLFEKLSLKLISQVPRT